LLEAAERSGFDVLITVDRNIPDQQNLALRSIAIVILCGRTNRLRDLEKLARLPFFRSSTPSVVGRLCGYDDTRTKKTMGGFNPSYLAGDMSIEKSRSRS
jgi:hypothetical protein